LEALDARTGRSVQELAQYARAAGQTHLRRPRRGRVPARTPRDIVLRMNAEINKALMSPAVSEKLIPAGMVITGGTPEEFAEHLRRETAKWAGVIKTAGIKPQ
jgi:tripartite-type tricarboxylate transporter receptor subunit TctC